jgi:hypothetical protein
VYNFPITKNNVTFNLNLSTINIKHMNATAKNLLVGVGAVLAGGLTIALMETLGHSLVPPPTAMNPEDLESIKTHAHLISPGSHALVIIAHALGAFVAGFIVAKWSGDKHRAMVHIMGFVFTIIVAINLFILPHPWWFIIADLCVCLPFAILGGKLARPQL